MNRAGAIEMLRPDHVVLFHVVAHVGPRLRHVAVERLARRKGRGERLAREVDRLALGDEVEDLGLEDVDTGVDGVAEHLSPGRLLEEPLDGSVLTGDDDAELERIVDRLQGQGGQTAPAIVEVDHLGQVDVGEHVSGDDQEPLVELVAGVPDRAGGAQGGGLGGVDHADAELRSVPEVGADGIGHEGHGYHDVLEAVLAEQIDDVLHHGDVDHGEHGLGLIGGQGAEPCALAAGHDDCFHDVAPSVLAFRPAANAFLATGR